MGSGHQPKSGGTATPFESRQNLIESESLTWPNRAKSTRSGGGGNDTNQKVGGRETQADFVLKKRTLFGVKSSSKKFWHGVLDEHI